MITSACQCNNFASILYNIPSKVIERWIICQKLMASNNFLSINNNSLSHKTSVTGSSNSHCENLLPVEGSAKCSERRNRQTSNKRLGRQRAQSKQLYENRILEALNTSYYFSHSSLHHKTASQHVKKRSVKISWFDACSCAYQESFLPLKFFHDHN